VATIIPILLTICLSIAQANPATAWLGPVLYLIIYPLGTCILSWLLFKLGKRSGLEGMRNFMAAGKLDTLTDTMTVLGLLVVGALTASFVSLALPIQLTRDVYDAVNNTLLENQVIFNADNVVNAIFPKLLPLGLTLGVYFLYARKKFSPLALMGIILVLALFLTWLGYATGFYA
jgi:PTS system mannose-specific IID component